MSTYYEVVLRDDDGTYIARVDPEDYGYSLKIGAGGQFDTKVMPAVLNAAVAHFGRSLTPIWVDDMSGDGWDSDPNRKVPWDGPVSLYDEPELPYLIPPGENDHSVPRGREVQPISIVAV